MRKFLYALLVITILSHTLFAADSDVQRKTVFNQYLADGELVTIERSKNAETSPYEYTYKLFITKDETTTNIWTKFIYHVDVKENFNADKALIMYDIVRSEKGLNLVYTFKEKIYFDFIAYSNDSWNEPKSREIPTELAKTVVESANIFAPVYHAYIFIEKSNDVREYWQVTVDSPKLLWTSKDEEPRSTNTYAEWLEYIEKRTEERKKEIEAQKALIANSHIETIDNNNASNSGSDDDDDDENAADNNKSSNGEASADNADDSDTDHNSGSSDNTNNDDPENSDSALTKDSNKDNADPANSDKTNISDGTNVLTYIGISASSIILLTLIFLLLFRKRRI